MKTIGLICYFLLMSLDFTSTAQDSLMGYWSFDKFNYADGFFRDESPYSNSGVTNEVFASDGIKGRALSFNGINSYAEIASQGNALYSEIFSLEQGTISLWFKVNHIPLDFGIAPILYFGSNEICDFFDAANQGFIIEIGHSPIYPGNEHIFYTVWANGCTYPSLCFDSGFEIIKDEWHHYVVVVGEGFNTGYLNGEVMEYRNYNFGEETDSQFFADAPAKEKLWLGKGHWDRTEQYFDGAIDELKIFNKPLTATEVKSLYNEVKTTSVSTELEKDDGILLYPNPASERLEIKLSDVSFKVNSIKLLDSKGNLILQIEEIKNNNNIGLHKVTPGLYTVLLIGERSTIQKKLMVVK